MEDVALDPMVCTIKEESNDVEPGEDIEIKEEEPLDFHSSKYDIEGLTNPHPCLSPGKDRETNNGKEEKYGDDINSIASKLINFEKKVNEQDIVILDIKNNVLKKIEEMLIKVEEKVTKNNDLIIKSQNEINKMSNNFEFLLKTIQEQTKTLKQLVGNQNKNYEEDLPSKSEISKEKCRICNTACEEKHLQSAYILKSDALEEQKQHIKICDQCILSSRKQASISEMETDEMETDKMSGNSREEEEMAQISEDQDVRNDAEADDLLQNTPEDSDTIGTPEEQNKMKSYGPSICRREKKGTYFTNKSFHSPNKSFQSPNKSFQSPNKSFQSPNSSFHSKKTLKKEKTKRPCLFCRKFNSDISHHLLTVHKSEDVIMNILNLDSKKKRKALALIRKEGISKENERRFRVGMDPILIKKQNPHNKKLICLNCKGIYGSKTLYIHKKTCKPVGKRLGYIPLEAAVNMSDTSCIIPDDFKEKVLAKLNSDTISNVIHQESLIQFFGNTEFQKVRAKRYDKQTRDRVKPHMRRIAKLYVNFNTLREKNKNEKLPYANMFSFENYDDIRNCILELTNDNGNLKAGSLKLYDSTLKKATKAMINFYRQSSDQSGQSRAEQFLAHINDNSEQLVSQADWKNFQRRSELRLANNLPQPEEMKKLNSFLDSELNNLVSEFTIWNNHSFVELRRATLCRLTIFNGRRQAEVSQLTIKEWEHAKFNSYISEEQKSTLNKEEAATLSDYRIAYTKSKISNKDAFVLIPKSCFEPIDILCSPTVRESANVINSFVFASTGFSSDPASGYNDIATCCKLAGLKRNLNADQFRHNIATKFGDLQGVTANTEKSFLKHMSHSQEISKVIYQMPEAAKTIIEVGPLLHSFNSERKEHICSEDKMISVKTACLQPPTSGSTDDIDSTNEDEKLNPLKRMRTDTIQLNRSGSSYYTVSDTSKEKLSEEIFGDPPTSNMSENMEEKVFQKRVRKRQKTFWAEKDKKYIRTYFKDFIEGKEKTYPTREKVEKFLFVHKDFLGCRDSPARKKVRLRTQLYNFRKSSSTKHE